MKAQGRVFDDMAKIKQATKHTGRARKEQIVARLVEKFDSSSGLVFADYKGLTHRQLEALKKELKQLNSEVVIAKNSLIKLSLGKSQKYEDFKNNEGLNLPTATLFIHGDMVEPLKKLQKAIKNFGLPKIKFAVLEGSLTDEAGVLKIASLPNRETLLAQLVSTLNSPIQGFVVTLNGTIQKLVMTLDAVAKTKPSQPEPAFQGEAFRLNASQAEALEPQAASEPATSNQQPASEATTQQTPPGQSPSGAAPDQTTTQEDQPKPETAVEPADMETEDVKNQKPASPAGGSKIKNAN